jgi:Domain of unknown function (DUF4331)
MKLRTLSAALLAAGVVATTGVTVQASSHREAPNITRMPLVDGTDFYMFMSYEPSRLPAQPDQSGQFVTLIANYQPLQAPYGGPNYFTMDPNALYEIHIDNNGDGAEDVTFQFRFTNTLANNGAGIELGGVAIPLAQAGAITTSNNSAINVIETYSVKVVRGDRRANFGSAEDVTNVTAKTVPAVNAGAMTFVKPMDYVGTKTFPTANGGYAAYADAHIYDVNIPGCATSGSKLFVGQRREGFAVNLGRAFDLINAPFDLVTNREFPNAANPNANPNTNANADVANPGNVSNGRTSVTTLALEVPVSCLTNGDPVVGGWTTASIRQGTLADGVPSNTAHRNSLKQGGAWTQVSRLGMPLVNELVIGLKDKDRFNASKPKDDAAANFLPYVLTPTLPKLIDIAFATDIAGLGGSIAPSEPRGDLAVTFLTGIPGLNKPAANNVPSEMLRLNTGLPPVAFASQNTLGVLGSILAEGSVGDFLANIGSTSDAAGFPNGRRPKDDVVDISLAAVEGALCLANGAADSLGSTADGNVLGLNGIPGVAPTTSSCNASTTKVPAGLTTVQLNDGVNQALVPFLNRFPYLNHPVAGDTTPGN